MNKSFSRRSFLDSTAKAAALSAACSLPGVRHARAFDLLQEKPASAKQSRMVDIHMHYESENPKFIDDFLRVSDRLNLTGCMLTAFEDRKVVAQAAKAHPTKILPFGYVDLDSSDVVKQVEELHDLGFRGLGELEFVKKPYDDTSYRPVYELANRYKWVVLFHTGIVLRAKFHEPEDVSSYRMSAKYLETIARNYPDITVIGAHCGNPDYQWAAEIARWNPNVFFDLSGSTLKKFGGHLSDFSKIFWWSGTDEGTEQPNNDPSAFTKIVYGTDSSPNNEEHILAQYVAMFDACGVPESARKLVLGGTLAKILGLPD